MRSSGFRLAIAVGSCRCAALRVWRGEWGAKKSEKFGEVLGFLIFKSMSRAVRGDLRVVLESPHGLRGVVACVAAGDCRDGCCRQLLRNQQRHAQSTCSRLYWDGLIVGLEFRPSSGP